MPTEEVERTQRPGHYGHLHEMSELRAERRQGANQNEGPIRQSGLGGARCDGQSCKLSHFEDLQEVACCVIIVDKICLPLYLRTAKCYGCLSPSRFPVAQESNGPRMYYPDWDPERVSDPCRSHSFAQVPQVHCTILQSVMPQGRRPW